MTLNRVTFSATQFTLEENLLQVQRMYNAKVIPATTGKKVNTLSDNPISTSRILVTRNKVNTNDQYQSNITYARMNLNFADSQLAQVGDAVQRIREIALRANDAGLAASTRTQMGNQINDIKTEILSYANAKIDGKYAFSGTAVTTLPFAGTPTVFAGNSNAILTQATASLSVQMNVDGNEIFSGSGGGVDLFATIDSLVTAVQAGNGPNIATYVTNLDTANGQVNANRAKIGNRVQLLDANENALSEDRLQHLKNLSDLEDVDLDKAISELVTRETAMKLVFATSSRVLGVISGINLQ